MIDIDTVFILGAGASNPYGYPTGEALRDYICTDFYSKFPSVFDNTTLHGLKSTWITNAEQFSKIFRKSSTPSIDLFLARNHRYSEVGRLAIILSMFDAERSSKFREEIRNRNQDWYSYIYHRMTKSLIDPDSYNNFGNNKVAFVTFNYDRSLEYFFYESLRHSFSSAGDDDIVKEVKKIPILHVYGKVADLPWQINSNAALDYLEPDVDPYRRFSFDFLQKLKSNIKIIHDREQHDCSEIHERLSNAKKIFFLGFGYATENMEILQLSKVLRHKPEVYGTTLGFLEKEIETIRGAIRSGFEYSSVNILLENPRIKDMDCVTLLRNFL
jgi:hypothetical protein